MKRLSSEQIKSATTKELVAYYNHFAGKSISKFSSRAAAEKQCSMYAAPEQAEWASLSLAQKLALWHKERRCPHCGDIHNGITPAGKDGTVGGDERSFCHVCSTEFWNATGKPYNAPAASAARSVAIANSWNDPEVRAERSERNKVLVDGVEYRSVAEAFRQLRLPMGAHIRVRMDLKAAGKLTYANHNFIVKE